MPAEPQVRIFGSPQELFRAAAEEFCVTGSKSIQDHGRFTVALSGGSTPRGLHQELVTNFSSCLPWDKVFFFWGDERHVPPDSSDSNYRMANETLLSKLPISPENIFRVPAELPDARGAAGKYEQTLQQFFRSKQGAFPKFDFILLGMGPDGHTASLFPGTAALQAKDHLVVANWVDKLNTFRITFTYPVLNNAASVMFLVNGDEKAEMVRRALKDPAANLPCQKVRPVDGELLWYLDKGAALKL
ncbi:MAG: 6-phosphogluconolactonase [Acidobacteria bacterium 13_1_20CM_4_56_7]|jgi:6-phosphogluconolactonase|nr:MAG: 6-phosphogluconolactonase [Acidobacteria bacterium 13_1_20CM_4_56_7]PYV48420.1 MAG: 6-phosphogluconolactonase [Acidobacteriota bacterium]